VRERAPAIVLRRKMTPANPRPIQKIGGISGHPTEPLGREGIRPRR
jgi:hypothetical protein